MYNFNPRFYADVRIEDRYQTNIQYKAQKLENYRCRQESRAFIRVFDGAMWYYTSTAQLDRVQQELDELYASCTAHTDVMSHPVVAKYEVNKETKMRFASCSVRDLTKQQKMQALSGYLGITANPYVQMESIIYLDRNSIYSFYSSKGAELHYDYQTVGVVISFSMASESDNFSHSINKSGVVFDDVLGHEKLIKQEVAQAQDFLLNAVPCDKGDFPVILSPVVAGVFAHESFGHKSEADFMIGDDNAAKAWTIGSTVGSPLLSIYDCGTDDGSGYVPFDDEGTRARKNYLIKDGKLAGRLHSALTASLLDESLTGNARAIDCKYEPIVRMTTTVIDAGDSSFEQLLSGIKDGYYIANLAHGSGMSKFTIAPTLCYRIKEGKLDKPTKIAVLTGDVFETLSLVDGLSKEHEIFSFVTGGCGKMEQSGLPVGFGGPYVRISKLNVQ